MNERILETANKEQCLVVVSLHNHPDRSGFSLQDLLVFCENESIRLMVVVNTDGKISYLQRPRYMNLKSVIYQNMENEYPRAGFTHLIDHVNDWKDKNKAEKLKIRYIIDDIETRKKITINTLSNLAKVGAIYKPYEMNAPMEHEPEDEQPSQIDWSKYDLEEYNDLEDGYEMEGDYEERT